MHKKLYKYFSNQAKKQQQITAGIVIFVVAGLGIYLLNGSHAATPYASNNASSGTLAGCASVQSDSSANNGSKVVFGTTGGCTGIPVGNPYIDPAQLSTQGISLYRQPWRGYMETEPATKFLDGIGVNYNPVHDSAAQDNANLQYLASIGVHAIRIELPWNAVSPTDETKLTAASTTKFNAIFAACKQYGITPTILLNANDGAPEPLYPSYTATVVGSPAIGDSQITITGVAAANIIVHQPGTATGGSGVTGGSVGQAGNLITNMVTNGDGSLTLTLSQPLKVLPAAGKETINYFKYMPFYPVGTAEFNNTMAGWLQYVKTATNTAEAAGITNYSVEIWNELTFGSKFLGINNYYPSTAKLYATLPDSLKSGGSSWELANQTTQYLKTAYGSNVKIIWGFSNTTFYHTASSALPNNTDGESYHPYGTDDQQLSAIVGGGAGSFHEGTYVPNMDIGIPESITGGLADVSGSNLIVHKLAPSIRESSLPPGTATFLHYITETGDRPSALPLPANAVYPYGFDTNVNQGLKARAFLREYSFWLNKGLDQYDVFAAFDSDNQSNDRGWNMLAQGSDVSGSPVTAQAQALQNFTNQFAGAASLASSRNLGVTVNDITANDNTAAYNVFPADPTTGEPALHYREMFQFLPFQVTDHKFVISTYMMGWNLATPPPTMNFQVNITNVNGTNATASYYDPITNTTVPITVVSKSSSGMVLNIQSVDYPRLITIDENGS